MTTLILTINEKIHHFKDFDPRTTLLDLCRHQLHLTGSKKGCDHGQCGACTILINGVRVNGCLTLAVMHEGDTITTIEGIGTPDALSDLQQAFIDHDAFQCGYCTPGQICSATALIEELKTGAPSYVSASLSKPDVKSLPEISERMSGNLCRCSAYPNIVNAIYQVISDAKIWDNASQLKDHQRDQNQKMGQGFDIWSPPPDDHQIQSHESEKLKSLQQSNSSDNGSSDDGSCGDNSSGSEVTL